MIFGGLTMGNKVRQREPVMIHPLVKMRDPEIAHGVLSGKSYGEVQICTCCWNHEKVLCPYRGHEPFGACPSYVLDEADVQKTEARMMEFLTQPRQYEQLLAA